MHKWYDEEYEFTVEVTGFLHGDKTENYCRNGEEIGDKYTCTYGCPVNQDGCGICSKTMMMLYPLMEAVRSGGDLEYLGGNSKYEKTVVCPDGCVIFKLTAKPLGNENFHKGGFYNYPDQTV
jgi:uncharacterized repeat protein (TIGR04076 family)